MKEKEIKENKQVDNQEAVTPIAEVTPKKIVREIDKLKGSFTIKPTKKSYLYAQNKEHDGAVMFSKSFVLFPPAINPVSGLIATGLTDQMARDMEQLMGLPAMTLSYSNPYWNNHKIAIKVYKDGTVLNVDTNPLDKLRYYFAVASGKVALTEEDLATGTYEFIMVSKEITDRSASDKFAIKAKAFSLYNSLKMEDHIDILKVYESGRYKVNKSASPDTIASHMSKVMEENPQKMMDTYYDPNFKMSVFLEDGISTGIIKTIGSKYIVNGTQDVIGNNWLDAINNLQQPEYNAIRIAILTKLQALMQRYKQA